MNNSNNNFKPWADINIKKTKKKINCVGGKLSTENTRNKGVKGFKVGEDGANNNICTHTHTPNRDSNPPTRDAYPHWISALHWKRGVRLLGYLTSLNLFTEAAVRAGRGLLALGNMLLFIDTLLLSYREKPF